MIPQAPPAPVPPPPPVPPQPPPPRSGPAGRPAGNPARLGRHLGFRIPTLVVGGLLTVCLLGVGTFAVANLLVRTTERDTTTLTGDIRRVEVHVTGSAHITAGPDGAARITRRSSFGVSRPEVREELADGLLVVRVECQGGMVVVCDNRIDLEVPADVSLSIHGFGTYVTDIRGDVEIDSGAGPVELTRLSGRITADVGGGSVTGRDLASVDVRAAAGAGSVDLGFAVAPESVDADSGAGSVTVTVPQDEGAYRVEADAGAGDDTVTVSTDPTSERVIKATAGAGSVEVRYA